jgi:hypothetical protein
MAERVAFLGTEEGVIDALQTVVGEITTGAPGVPQNYLDGFLVRCSNSLLSQIKQDYVSKSRGAVGRDGIRWPELSPQTIARRRLGPPDKKLLTDKARLAKLPPDQQKTLKKLIRQRTAQYMARGMHKDKAARIARQVTFRGKVPTKLSILGGRSVQILVDTGVMLATLEPGYEATPNGNPNQVLETSPGRLAVGSKLSVNGVNIFACNHFGTKRIPSRPSWPLDGNLPEEWWDAVLGAAQRGLILIAVIVFQNGGRL